MTREQKITKLVNAIVAYRGIRDGVDGPWKVGPKPGKREDILKWMGRLGLPTEPDPIQRIDGFKSFGEMYAWLRGVRAYLMSHSPQPKVSL